MDLAIPRLVQRVIDQGINGRDLSIILNTFLIMLGISALNFLFAVGNNNLSVRVGERTARDLREAIFLKVQSFSFGNLDRLKTGQLLVRLSSDSAAIQRLVQVTLRVGTRAPLLIVGSLFLMFKTDKRLALLMLPLLLLTSAFIVFFVFKMGPLFLSVQRRLDKLNNVLQENIAGVRVVKAFVRASHEAGRFEEANEEYAAFGIRLINFFSVVMPVLGICVNIGIVAGVWIGGLEAIRGGMTIGQVVAFINYLQTTIGPLMIMAMLANVWGSAMASGERLGEVLDADPEVRDAPDAVDLPTGAKPRVVFENVSFRYRVNSDGNGNGNGNGGAKNGGAGGAENVLENLNLIAEPGQTVAILGATGSGKSTLVNLIPRFYDVTAGRVLIDGLDVRQIRQDSLLAHIGIVPQETVLFSGTIRDNIRFGKPEATEDEIVAAARAAHAHDFILDLPQGYDTRVEERGVNLSGGQKQRLAIARALITRPAILILDDSTSSIDVETETKIETALEEWMKGRTRFVVAQRLSTVLTADKILVIDDGRIAAEGTHRELLASSPIYREICDSQLGDRNCAAEEGS